MLFSIGDYLAGMTVGAVTALGVRMVVWPGMDMVIAMIVGMTLGMLIHIVLGLVMAPLIGMFNAMMPASLIGVYVRQNARCNTDGRSRYWKRFSFLSAGSIDHCHRHKPENARARREKGGCIQRDDRIAPDGRQLLFPNDTFDTVVTV